MRLQTPQDQAQMEYEIFHDLQTTNGESEAEANAYALWQLNDRFNQHGYQFSTEGTGRYAHIDITGMTDGKENRTGKYYDWEGRPFPYGCLPDIRPLCKRRYRQVYLLLIFRLYKRQGPFYIQRPSHVFRVGLT